MTKDFALNWLQENRFGLFIHWGLYSLLARHEWVQKLEHIHPDEYVRYAACFEPDLYDPDLWADIAEKAGITFSCFTAKHHDGFCMWDTNLTDFKVTNTPYGKNLLTSFMEAFKKKKLKTGLYYSLIDWHHPDFMIDSLHPLSNHPDRDTMNKKRNQKKYIDYMHRQVKDLMIQYKPVELLFFDFSYPKKIAWPPNLEDNWHGKSCSDWDSEDMINIIKDIEPNVLINERLGLDDEKYWDYITPEQYEPAECPVRNNKKVPWITCQTFSGSWGYNRDEESWRSLEQILYSLINTVSKGGSLLLNVGPDSRGCFDERVLQRMKGIAEWMYRHKRSIHNCTAAPDEFKPPQNCIYTYNPDKKLLYVHILAWPNTHLYLENLAGRVRYAQLLHDGSEIKIGIDKWFADQQKNQLLNHKIVLSLPIKCPNVKIPVIELFLK